MTHRVAIAAAAGALALLSGCNDDPSTATEQGVLRILAVEPAAVQCAPGQRFGLSVRYETDDVVSFTYAVNNANVAVESASGSASASFVCRTAGAAVVTITAATPRRSATATVPVTVAAAP